MPDVSKVKAFLYLICCLPLLYWSCSREEKLKSPDIDKISEAKKWFESQNADFLVNWDRAKYNKETDRIVVPLIWNAILDNGGLSTRKLSISGNKAGPRAAKIIEIVPAKAYSLKHGTYFNMKDFEGSLGLFDLNLNFLRGEFYKKGERAFPATFMVYPSREAYANTPHVEGCVYTQTAYYSNGVLTVIGSQSCNDYWIIGGGGSGTAGKGTEPGDPITDEIDEGDPPGGEQATEFYYAHVEEIVDSLHTPCFKNTLALVVRGGFNSALVHIMNRVFGYNEALEVTVMEDQLPANLSGTEQSFRSGMYIRSTITLNQSIATASQEYVAATLLHEALHAYFSAKNAWPLRDANNVQHNVMANQYVSEMASGLQYMFPNLSSQDAINLAWGGLHGTLAWQNMQLSDPNKINGIINTNNNYRAGSTGTVCK